MLNNIRIILVETTHPGNIGAVARAMKTMGLSRLYLVAPHHYPDEEATARASGADDILQQAKVVPSLEQALNDCSFVVGTSARLRSMPWQVLAADECANMALQEAGDLQQVAIVFGRERIGLTNEELALCHYHVVIPANPEYSSLNIAAAVQIVAYEIYKGYLQQEQKDDKEPLTENLASSADMEQLFLHLEQVMIATEFLNPLQPKKLMLRLKRLFSRARPTQQEVNILRGILTSVDKKLES